MQQVTSKSFSRSDLMRSKGAVPSQATRCHQSLGLRRWCYCCVARCLGRIGSYTCQIHMDGQIRGSTSVGPHRIDLRY
jgi:hypothetical protein